MVIQMKRELRSSIENSEWIDEQTKLEALNKLYHMFDVLGYQSWIKNDTQLEAYYFELSKLRSNQFLDAIVELDKANALREFRRLTEFESRESMEVMPATDVNAYHYLRRNLIAIPAALLQQPLYTHGLPSSLNFGAIGFVIGHELLHAFDEEGKQYNKYGNYKDWWTNVTSLIYGNKSSCFVEHYSRLTDPQSNLRIDAKLTKEENIADSLGLRIAFNSFRANIERNSYRNEFTLSALRDFTAEQLFFIAFAQLWCVNETMESKRTTITYGPHSPEYFRVIGSLSNSAHFAKAFRCSKHSRMNAERKCLLW
ncbi:CBN-NEP-1 protein-like protein [Leptotrombidium deliense]|uniref:CBN-NEP-1 protein-like protein n=1 Tax=Leptotrombidium deliense TaxID=299467 RepID=A0A443SQF3_9ACAR|nr:CBN-NEP-1 protein-like protein [Leptotrombidium deliense]